MNHLRVLWYVFAAGALSGLVFLTAHAAAPALKPPTVREQVEKCVKNPYFCLGTVVVGTSLTVVTYCSPPHTITAETNGCRGPERALAEIERWAKGQIPDTVRALIPPDDPRWCRVTPSGWLMYVPRERLRQLPRTPACGEAAHSARLFLCY